MAPTFHSLCMTVWKWLFSLSSSDVNHTLHTVFLFPIRWKRCVWGGVFTCMCVHVWVYVRPTKTETKKRDWDGEGLSLSERVFELLSRDLCHFSYCLLFRIIFHYYGWLSFLLLLNHKENISSSDKIMKPEEFLGEHILMCYVELSHFVFFIKGLNSINYEAPTSTVIWRKIHNEDFLLKNDDQPVFVECLLWAMYSVRCVLHNGE